MAIRCPKCDQELTAGPAQPCPQCGYKASLLPEWILWADILICILAVVGFFVTSSPVPLGAAVLTFLYMIYDLGARNAHQMAVRAAEARAMPEVPTGDEGTEEEAEEGPGSLEDDGEADEDEELIPEEEDDSTCSSCGATLEEGAKFCGKCGQKQAG
ncbi:MAG TPA: zinc ribbon domain-containing protein [bacterium]|nr:zinc ribbon domain-containing protein [bacterium]